MVRRVKKSTYRRNNMLEYGRDRRFLGRVGEKVQRSLPVALQRQPEQNLFVFKRRTKSGG